jgi:hypothetical protein
MTKHLWLWLLVLVNYEGGIDHIAQPSRDRCAQQAAWINSLYSAYTSNTTIAAFCVEQAGEM